MNIKGMFPKQGPDSGDTFGSLGFAGIHNLTAQMARSKVQDLSSPVRASIISSR